jgi:protocatechuate 4,5-dioxygenase beta chain/2,3-dihydroxyphenylpropionate 1,2-dioxygenase
MSSHAPNITAKPEIADPPARVRFVSGLEEIRRRLEAARPDVLVVFANDHLQNFFYDNMPALAVGVAERYWAPSAGGAAFLRVPARQIPGASEWAKAFVRAGLDQGFDVSYAHELEFWDDLSVPLHFLLPDATIPIVPILTNCVAPPLPRPRRSYELGAFVAAFIDDVRPGAERVALLGTGGISHWIGVPGHGRINPEFDHRVLDAIREGRGESLAFLTHDEIEREAGNGGQEIRNWIAVLGALHDKKGEVLCYEPVPEWLTGSAGVWMEV